jgi:hypothetical protein
MNAKSGTMIVKERPMAEIKMGAIPAELPKKRDATVEADDPGLMSRQDVWDFHGHEIHPQQFVRLVGWRDSKAQKRRLH